MYAGFISTQDPPMGVPHVPRVRGAKVKKTDVFDSFALAQHRTEHNLANILYQVFSPSTRTFSVMWDGTVGVCPGQGGHQSSALNAAEEGSDPGAISISNHATVCVSCAKLHLVPFTADYRSLEIGVLTLEGRYKQHWLPVGSRWRDMIRSQML